MFHFFFFSGHWASSFLHFHILAFYLFSYAMHSHYMKRWDRSILKTAFTWETLTVRTEPSKQLYFFLCSVIRPGALCILNNFINKYIFKIYFALLVFSCFTIYPTAFKAVNCQRFSTHIYLNQNKKHYTCCALVKEKNSYER